MLPEVVKHLPLHAVGNLRSTCRALRVLPCILAVPTSVLSRANALSKLLDTRESISFLQSLPRLCSIHLVAPKSLFGLHRLPHLTQVSINSSSRSPSLDFRPLQELDRLRRLELKLGKRVD